MSMEDSKKELLEDIKIQILTSVSELLSTARLALRVLKDNLENDALRAESREETAMKVLNKLFADRTDDGVISVASFNIEQLNKLIEEIENNL